MRDASRRGRRPPGARARRLGRARARRERHRRGRRRRPWRSSASGRNLVGLCPFHKEKTPSFSVNPERQFYHCFGCKAGGDVFRFVQETEKVGFLEAVEMLSRRAGHPGARAARRGERGARAAAARGARGGGGGVRAVARRSRSAAPRRARYLERRGLDARDAARVPARARARRLGEPGPAAARPRSRDEVLVAGGLAARRETGAAALYDRFRNRLMVPLVAPGGAVVGFGARALPATDQPKYLNSPETAGLPQGLVPVRARPGAPHGRAGRAR